MDIYKCPKSVFPKESWKKINLRLSTFGKSTFGKSTFEKSGAKSVFIRLRTFQAFGKCAVTVAIVTQNASVGRRFECAMV